VRRFPLTLLIEGVRASSNDDALEILRKVGDSLLFVIDLSFELPLVLASARDTKWIVREALDATRDDSRRLGQGKRDNPAGSTEVRVENQLYRDEGQVTIASRDAL
jgi:hypothetical protein